MAGGDGIRTTEQVRFDDHVAKCRQVQAEEQLPAAALIFFEARQYGVREDR